MAQPFLKNGEECPAKLQRSMGSRPSGFRLRQGYGGHAEWRSHFLTGEECPSKLVERRTDLAFLRYNSVCALCLFNSERTSTGPAVRWLYGSPEVENDCAQQRLICSHEQIPAMDFNNLSWFLR